MKALLGFLLDWFDALWRPALIVGLLLWFFVWILRAAWNESYGHHVYQTWTKVNPQYALSYDEWKTLKRAKVLPGQAASNTHVQPIIIPVK